MVALTKPALKPSPFFAGIPAIDLSEPGSAARVVAACEELGFFKVTNHGVPTELMARLEAEAVRFFALPQPEKELAGPASPFGYGSRTIGSNGDVGWVEYLLMEIASKPTAHASLAFLREPSAKSFCYALNEYIMAVRRVACEVLEKMAEGLGLEPRDVLSRVVMDEESDSVLRLNHYPPLPSTATGGSSSSMTGFGEHTDPQIISVLRSNNIPGLEISLKDGTWVSVLPDHHSLFINVGDSLQVLTNGRFRSVRHRVRVVVGGGGGGGGGGGMKSSRVSMIYFGGPPSRERLAPLPPLLVEGEPRLYRDFTWWEYKASAYKSRLADNRLQHFQITF